MGILDGIKKRGVESRLKEEFFYELATQEIETGKQRRGLWAKALLVSEGNDQAAKREYLKLLAKKIEDEYYIAQQLVDESRRQNKILRRREEAEKKKNELLEQEEREAEALAKARKRQAAADRAEARRQAALLKENQAKEKPSLAAEIRVWAIVALFIASLLYLEIFIF